MYSDPTGHDDVVVTTEDGTENLDRTYDYETGEYTDLDSIHSSRGSGYTETPEYDKKKRLFYIYNKELQRNVFIEYDTTQALQDAPVYFNDDKGLNGTTMKVTVVNCGDEKYRVNTKQYYEACGYKNVQVTKRTDQVNSSANETPEAQDVVKSSDNISVNIQGDNLGSFQTEISDKNGVLISYDSDGYGNPAVMSDEEFEKTKQDLIQDAVITLQCPAAPVFEAVDYGFIKLGERIAISRGEKILVNGASRVVTRLENNIGVRIDTIEDLTKYGKNLGNNGQLFLTNKNALKGLDLTNLSDLSKAEKILGLPEGKLTNSKGVVMSEINVTNKNVRLPESGNEFFVPGGYTSGGVPEIIIDPINIFTDPAVTSMQIFYH